MRLSISDYIKKCELATLKKLKQLIEKEINKHEKLIDTTSKK